ncbi:alpha-1,2-mannosidase, putative subfamily [Tothia fuscella]|uniref:Alpha-1,2-mannosidase, putative subfamily n=1 Tax=Tothia fuscella TaxID=1048955 RepID=A0A9P4NQN5_9PEZI|nr:alpha-1,2-mannosidase, putative subfamily [Tothia fuscella]
MKSFFLWALALFLGCSVAADNTSKLKWHGKDQAYNRTGTYQPQQYNYTTGFDYVDPLIGTSAGGHVFPGATMPFGMAKAVADVNGENQGGFSSENGNVMGFSHMHDSGTGGSPSLGNFPIWPQSTCHNDDVSQCSLQQFDRAVPSMPGSVKATPGYFALELQTGIKAEMTVTNHTALYRFTFPEVPHPPLKGPLSPLIHVDLADLPGSRSNASVLVDEKTGRIIGNGTFNPSFGIGHYDLHFCADFQGAGVRDTGVWINDRAGSFPKHTQVTPDGVNGNNSPLLAAGAYVRFDAPKGNRQILVRVGMSFISAKQACENAEREIPNFDFKKTLTAAEDAWKEKLDVVKIEPGGVDNDLLKTFWSGIYRTMISPQDYTGENPLWKSKEPYYDSFYCIWDSFRSIHQLLTILDPQSQTLIVRALIDIYRYEGKLPDCRMSLCKGFTQGGSNADTLLVDSWLKGIVDKVDWETGYKAMISDAEEEPLNWSVEGRGGLTSWKSIGYIPIHDFDPYGVGPFTRSISRTVEYAYNDFNIATMAKFTGRNDDYEKYIKRSQNWKNLFKADQRSEIARTDTGFAGFLQPKTANGTWEYQDPLVCSHEANFDGCYLNPTGKETYEGSPWLYTFYVPGDMATLIQTLGGPDTFVKRLDFFHTSKIAYIGDEQFFLPVFLYHYAGRPGLSAFRAHYYIPRLFFAAVNGLPGNDDSGAMGSFAALTMMGIFPNAGQNVYFITPPFFKSVSIKSKVTGKTATIRNINFDTEYDNIYIRNATLNGRPWTNNWISHDFFLEGGVLELTLGPKESQWGTRPQDLPPSLSTGSLGHRSVPKKM